MGLTGVVAETEQYAVHLDATVGEPPNEIPTDRDCYIAADISGGTRHIRLRFVDAEGRRRIWFVLMGPSDAARFAAGVLRLVNDEVAALAGGAIAAEALMVQKDWPDGKQSPNDEKPRMDRHGDGNG